MPEESNRALAIHLEGVTVSYGGVEILRSVSLDVLEGQLVAIVGKSGSGKTTLLKAINKLLHCSGTVDVEGRARMVFQEDRLLPWFKVRSNIAIAMSGQRGATNGQTSVGRERAAELLSEFGMSNLADRYPHQLSGGERQRVAIARAFAARPDVVLMDEPFGALDVLTRESMQEWLLAFWRHHRAAIVFVTHDVEEGLVLADRLAVLRDGELLTPTVVPFDRPRDPALRFSGAFLTARQEVRSMLAGGRDSA